MAVSARSWFVCPNVRHLSACQFYVCRAQEQLAARRHTALSPEEAAAVQIATAGAPVSHLKTLGVGSKPQQQSASAEKPHKPSLLARLFNRKNS